MLEELVPGDLIPADKGFKMARARINLEQMHCVTKQFIG